MDLSKKKIVIAGCGQNIRPYIQRVFKNIYTIARLFNDYKIVIFENDSIDNTLEILNAYDKKDPNMILLTERNIPVPTYLHPCRIAYCRNRLLEKINNYLKSVSIDVEGDMLKDVSSISCNNDVVLGEIIAQAYEKAGKDSVVLMEGSETNETYVKLVDGVQLDECSLTSTYFITNQDKQYCELEDPLVLIVASEIPNVRKYKIY